MYTAYTLHVHYTYTACTDLAGIMETRYFKTHDVVFDEGEYGDKLYVLIEGSVTMYKRSTKQIYRQVYM